MGSKTKLQSVFDTIIESLHSSNIPFDEKDDYIELHIDGDNYKLTIDNI